MEDKQRENTNSLSNDVKFVRYGCCIGNRCKASNMVLTHTDSTFFYHLKAKFMLQKMKQLPGVKKLTLAEQKKVIGGQSCTMTYLDANGNWQTESGNCELAYMGQGIGGSGIYQSYCKTTHFTAPVPLSSNGGVSRCGQQTTLLGMLFG